MDVVNSPLINQMKMKPLSRSSSLLSALPRLAIPHPSFKYSPPPSSPLSAPPLSAPLFSSPVSAETPPPLPPPPPPSAASPYRQTPILSRLILPSPLARLPSPIPTRFLQVRSLRAERFTVEYLIARFPLAVRIWASTNPGIAAARVEFESVDIAVRVLDQHGGDDAWRMGSYELEIEEEGERNRWWENVGRRTCADVRNGELKEEVGNLPRDTLKVY